MTVAKKMPETLTLTEAQKRLGVARNTLWRVIKKYNVPTFNDVFDSRAKRARLSDFSTSSMRPRRCAGPCRMSSV